MYNVVIRVVPEKVSHQRRRGLYTEVLHILRNGVELVEQKTTYSFPQSHSQQYFCYTEQRRECFNIGNVVYYESKIRIEWLYWNKIRSNSPFHQQLPECKDMLEKLDNETSKQMITY